MSDGPYLSVKHRFHRQRIQPSRAFRVGCLVVLVPIDDPEKDRLFVLSVSLLHRANELVVVACDLQQIVIGKFAPLFLKIFLELTPLAFELIPIHSSPICFLGGMINSSVVHAHGIKVEQLTGQISGKIANRL
jgi:hypothetical protein